MTGKEVNIQKAITLAKSNLANSIWKSTIIEGLSIPQNKVEAILNNQVVNINAKEVLFIVNMRDAWKFIIDIYGLENDIVVLSEINKICGNNLIYGSGILRTIKVKISGTSYIPPIPDQWVVQDKLRELDITQDAVDKALEYFCYVAKSQSFVDGNKRVAQLICNKILIENGIGILSIDENKMKEFK